MKEKNDFKRLKKEADIDRVVRTLGIKTSPKGNSIFIRCPIPTHDDEHATNCYYQKGWHNVYCAACGRSVQAIDLIMYSTGYSYGEAADMLWDLEGRPSWYKATGIVKGFTITGEEADLLGINTYSWKDYLTEPQFKRFVKKQCEKRIAMYDDIDNFLSSSLFEDERRKINGIKTKLSKI